MIFAPTINDLAICLAYALMNKKKLIWFFKDNSFKLSQSISFDL
jgi:hypothetical protein